MNCLNKSLRIYFYLILFLLFQNSAWAQFEQGGIRMTGSELEIDLLADSTSTYLKIMLCGDLMHTNDLYNTYGNTDGLTSYRQWYRQIKPLFYFSDFVVGNLKTLFPDNSAFMPYGTAAPDDFLGEIGYTGFNVLMMANNLAQADRASLAKKTLNKVDKMGIYKAGQYLDSNDRKENYPLILEKKDIRVAFLNYSLDSILLDYSKDQVNFFTIEDFERDIKKTKEMLPDFTILYMDWAGYDSLKLALEAELLNYGVDVIVGSGKNGFTSADLLSYTKNEKKLLIDNIGQLNATSHERENNKSALIEIVLRKDIKTEQVVLYDMGFIPTWTLKDPNRYAVLPITNIEEKHIKNINVNFMQYSAMKIALTDLRYAFFDKLPELHYDYTDKTVTAVEQTVFIRRTLLSEQDKFNQRFKERADSLYRELFGQDPITSGTFNVPYDDILQIYAPVKKSTKKPFDPLDRISVKDSTPDETSETGILNVKANRKFYTRVKDTTTPLTIEQKAALDSIKRYNDRFIVYDSIGELKKMLKRKKLEAIRIKDSIYKANLDPNYRSKTPEIVETVVVDKNPYRQQRKTGVFTTTESESRQAKNPIKEIEEYFFVQIYSLSSFKNLDTDKSPYLAGYEVRYEDGVYRYLIGRTRSPKLAIEVCKSIRGKGHPEALVVRYTDGIRSIYKANF